MPELPEVEAARTIICQHCKGRQITKVDAADDAKVFDGATPEQLVAALKGRTLLDVGRKGKQLWFNLEGEGSMPLMHFGMTGYVAVKDAADGKVHVVAYENAPQDITSNWPPRFHKLLLQLGPSPSNPASPSCELAYCDARRFGRIKLVAGDPAACDAVSKLGFDPLTAMPDLEGFRGLLAAKAKGAARLKPLLLDQSFCAGVGNWVADEVLWHTRLHPEQLLSALQPEHTAALHTALQQVVQTAVAANADSSKFPRDWMFHVRWGKKAGSLLGHKLDHITVGSRTSCYVPALQKLIGGAAKASNKAAKPSAGKRKQRDVSSEPEAATEDKLDEAAGDSAGEESTGEAANAAGSSKAKKQQKKPAKAAKQGEAAATDEQPKVAQRASRSRKAAGANNKARQQETQRLTMKHKAAHAAQHKPRG